MLLQKPTLYILNIITDLELHLMSYVHYLHIFTRLTEIMQMLIMISELSVAETQANIIK